jgi:hypothetical protein
MSNRPVPFISTCDRRPSRHEPSGKSLLLASQCSGEITGGEHHGDEEVDEEVDEVLTGDADREQQRLRVAEALVEVAVVELGFGADTALYLVTASPERSVACGDRSSRTPGCGTRPG